MVVSKDGGQAQRFLAVDVYQMSLVEPETKRLGWGVVKFAGLLQVAWAERPAFPYSLWLIVCNVQALLIIPPVQTKATSCVIKSLQHLAVLTPMVWVNTLF